MEWKRTSPATFTTLSETLVENPGEKAYLTYVEDISKNRPGGLRGRNTKAKEVIHHANTHNPQRCFVRLFKLYQQLVPENRPDHAFYVQPLKKPTSDCWFSNKPLGHQTLAGTVARLCKQAGITGFKTNHSLRATAATQLYQSGVEEQLVMERTGHRSLDGVRHYKRTSDEQRETISDILNSKRPCIDTHTNATCKTTAMNIQSQPNDTTVATTNFIGRTQCALTAVNTVPGTFNITSCSSVTINFHS